MRLFLTATLALLATPALAAPALHFDRDGTRYEYTASHKADGSLLLTGQVANTGEDFELRVANGRVQGSMGATRVDFTLSKAAVAALETGDTTAIAAN